MTKHPETIKRAGGDNTVRRTVDHLEQLMAEAEQDGLDLHLDSITVCLEDEGRNSAILGLKVHVVND